MKKKAAKPQPKETGKIYGVIFAAGIVKLLIHGAAIVTAMKMERSAFTPWEVGISAVALVLAGLFLYSQHPGFGIAGTALYLAEKIFMLIPLLRILIRFEYVPVSQWVSFGTDQLVKVLLIAFFIYADCQAVSVRRLEKESHRNKER